MADSKRVYESKFPGQAAAFTVITGLFLVSSTILGQGSLSSEGSFRAMAGPCDQMPLSAIENERSGNVDPEKNPNPNMCAINIIDIVYLNISGFYERFVGRGNVGLRFPFSVAVPGSNTGAGTSVPHNKQYAAGFAIDIFPVLAEKQSLFFAPLYELGQYVYMPPLSAGVIYASEPELLEIYYSTFLLELGYLFKPAPKFNFSFVTGLGVRTDHKEMFYNYDISVKKRTARAWSFQFNLCYRF